MLSAYRQTCQFTATFTQVAAVPKEKYLSCFLKYEDAMFLLKLYPAGRGAYEHIIVTLNQFGRKMKVRCEIELNYNFQSCRTTPHFKDNDEIFVSQWSKNHIPEDSKFHVLCTLTFANWKEESETLSIPRELNFCWDVNFKVDNELIPSHKVILSALSPVFQAMFKSGMIESTTNEIVIDDFSVAAVKAFLNCLYSQEDCLSHLPSKTIVEVSKLSHKYCVESLTSICLAHLCALTSVENCLDKLALADENNWPTMKQFVLDFMQQNRRELIASSETKLRLMKSELLVDIVKAFAQL